MVQYNRVHRTTWCSTKVFTEPHGVVYNMYTEPHGAVQQSTQNQLVQYNGVHRTTCVVQQGTQNHMVQYNRVHRTTGYSVLQSTHNHMVQYNRINRTTGFSVQHSTQKNMVGLEYTESHKLKYIQRRVKFNASSKIKMYSKLQYNANRG